MDVHELPRPQRPHENVPTEQLQFFLLTAGRSARECANSGRIEDWNIYHLLADEYLDELQARGVIRPRNEEIL